MTSTSTTLTRPATSVAGPHGGIAVAYVRISKDGDGRGLGVARQREDVDRLARMLGVDLVEVIEDNDQSASAFAKRPRENWPRLVERVERGEISHVLAYSLSRLTRDMGEREELLAFRRLGVSVTTTQGQRIYPGMSAMEVGMIRQAGVADTQESEVLSERITRAFVQNAENGTPHGPIAYGWDRHRERNGVVVDTINPAEAAVLREVARRMIASEATQAIVRDLNAREIPAPRGGKWSTTILTKLMLRERNVARRVHQGAIVETNLPGGRASWEPLYDDDTHAAVVAHLRDPARLRRRGAQRHLLSGLLTCGGCRSVRLYVKHGATSRAYGCRDCRTAGITRDQEKLDLYVVEAVCARLARPDALDWLAQDAGALDAARERVATLRGKLAKRVDMLDAGDMGEDEFARSSRTIRAEIAEAEAAVEVARPLPGAVRALLGHGTAEATRAAWDALSIDQRKAAIRALVTITLDPKGRTKSIGTHAIRLDWIGEVA